MSTKSEKSVSEVSFNWTQQPEADAMYRRLVDEFCEACGFVDSLRQKMLAETGTRLIDWVDHLAVSENATIDGESPDDRLIKLGYEFDAENEHGRWFTHPGGLFVPICVAPGETRRLVVGVEAVDDFLAAHRIFDVVIQGPRSGQMRRALVTTEGNCEFWVCERQGFPSWSVPETDESTCAAAVRHYEAFKLRRRDFKNDREGFEFARRLISAARIDLGLDWTCDLFFACERDYWQRRNRAARVQKSRQDGLGLGWANHDHHTYRSSRHCFKDLISVLELLGFRCRERFYAGEDAGWGAQVLEQPGCGIVIFADVDLSSAELEGDFAHDGLGEKPELGTVGLWCQLHGEAFLQAGMHHLECTFDFVAARDQLRRAGVETMAEFTDFGYLRQAFTRGEVWKSIPARTEAAVVHGYISREQADRFINEGTVGSHMEILERNDGFKGFNQAGVSDIIRKTDPRHLEIGN